MEVHQHTHTVPIAIGRKKWTHYFWEFLMLFLAVFCGFLAENQREHFVEKKREKEYVRSMIDDLKLDTIRLSVENADRRQAIGMYDSLMELLNQKDRNEFQQQRIYFLARMSIRLSPFPIMNDRAFEQMKSSGNLRLIHDKKIADDITKYYFNSKEFLINTNQSLSRLQSLIEYQGKVFDGAVFRKMINIENFSITPPDGNPPLITEDKKILNELFVRIHYVLSILLYYENYCISLKNVASQLIEILKKEYHLE